MVRDCPTLKHFNPRTPRGVRHGPVGPFRLFCDFNPRTPRGVRLEHFAYQPERCYFNPRTPRGVRHLTNKDVTNGLPFQSTHPARGATTGGDSILNSPNNFNPRTPRGVRPVFANIGEQPILFQSTHPARGATANFTKEQRVCLAQFAYLHKGKKAEHTKTNAPMLH